MSMKKSLDVSIPSDEYVTVTKMNHIVEVQHMEKENSKANIKKLSKESYVNLRTGEVCQFGQSSNRGDSLNSLRQTFKKLRYLINNNFVGGENELWITLTYAEKTDDHHKVGADWDKFIKRLKYRYKERIEFIRVIEPHYSGHFHLHVLLMFPERKSIFISNDELADIWGHGFVNIQRLQNVDNIGAYVSAYLTDLDLPEGKRHHKAVEKNGKNVIKGARLLHYPPGINIFTKSRGLKYPERKKMKFKDVKKVVGLAEPHYSLRTEISSDDFDNVVSHLQYNLLRSDVDG